MADRMSIDKQDPVNKDDSAEDSMDSSPEGESGNLNISATNTAQENQQPKRKGGRKPIYATSEERKQRNRQAQAAFRERRTEYIKQLEQTIQVHEQNLHNLQAAHRHAADECLMLRYKNSLLERILLEKGIDVQAELRAKTGSPSLGPTHAPQNLVQPPPLPRSILNRHHARRSASNIAPKLEPGMAIPSPLHPHTHSTAASPKNNRPTPGSHSASPSATASAFGASPAGSGSDHLVTSAGRPGLTSAVSSMKVQAATMPGAIPGMGQPPPARPMHPQLQAHAAAVNPGMRGAGQGMGAGPYYPTPGFQNHIEQLEQEYDAVDMADDAETPDTPSGPGPYPGAGTYGAVDHQHPHHLSMASPATSGPSTMDNSGTNGVPHSQHGGYPSMTQLLDPALEWDPFGLSASMAFPTQFSFDTSNMR